MASAEEKPLVSIITPVRNGVRYLETSIQNILNQTYPNIEHIYVDGGSTDGTLEILARYQSQYPDRIRFITGKDKGVGDAVNKGYKISRGEIIGWIDSDDIYEPDAVQTAVEFFEKNPEASFVYGGCNMINEEDDVIACFVIKDFDLQEWLNRWHYIVFCATFYRRQVIEKVGYLNNLGNDLDFWLRVNKHFKLHRIDKLLTSWRLNSQGISLKQNSREDKIRKNRAKEDFFLCVRYGGSVFSPRASGYRSIVQSRTAETMRPYLGFAYPLINRLFYQPMVKIIIRIFRLK